MDLRPFGGTFERSATQSSTLLSQPTAISPHRSHRSRLTVASYQPSSSSCMPVICTSATSSRAHSSGPWVHRARAFHHGKVSHVQSLDPLQPLSRLQRGFNTVSSQRSRSRLTCRAGLPEQIDSTLRSIITISSVVGISYAVLLAAVSEPPPPAATPLPPSSDRRALGTSGKPATGGTAGKQAGGAGGASEDNFVWGLMGFISCLPLFDWLAWVLAALSDEERAALYGTYAALYGSPLLLRGLSWQDPWALLMVALCVVHVQAERIAQTEPETLRSLRPVG
ncbi:hypothetical protein Agub_g2961, partial [Astrephomene gubernaculifera]